MPDISLFSLLDESSIESSIGDIEFDASTNTYIIPFLHEEIEYYLYFSHIRESGITSEDLQSALQGTESPIEIGDNPFTLKFGQASEYDTKERFAHTKNNTIGGLFRIFPAKLILMVKMLTAKKDIEFDNLIFIAGAVGDSKQRKLSLWYKRIIDNIRIQDIGYEVLFVETEAHCYGFKRINSESSKN